MSDKVGEHQARYKRTFQQSLILFIYLFIFIVCLRSGDGMAMANFWIIVLLEYPTT